MNFKSILIVTYARSGSTLLQGILNSIDGVLIRGENQNFIQGLYDAYLRLQYARDMKTRSGVEKISPGQSWSSSSAWYGADVINLQVFLEYSQSMIKNILLANYQEEYSLVCYGFKEVRYYDLVESGIKLEDYLYFLQQIFPQVAIVFNTRNLQDVTKSIIWNRRDRYDSLARLMRLENDFKSYHKKHPENTFSITYEDLISKSNNLKLLFDFIGAQYSEAKIDEVLSIPHSFGHRSINIVNGKVTLKSD